MASSLIKLLSVLIGWLSVGGSPSSVVLEKVAQGVADVLHRGDRRWAMGCGCRMTNDEIRKKPEARNPNIAPVARCLRHSDLGVVWSLGIRHSSFIPERFH